MTCLFSPRGLNLLIVIVSFTQEGSNSLIRLVFTRRGEKDWFARFSLGGGLRLNAVGSGDE